MSTLDIKFKPIVNENISNYYIYICEIDNFNILFDCGWNYHMDSYVINSLEKYGDNIDLILISGSSLKHVGSLAYVYTKFSWKCPIYMTHPVWQASKLTLYDYYQSLFNSITDIPFTLDDIDRVWDCIERVRYLQTINLKGKGQGISIVALNSGMTLGSCMWRITKDYEGDIIYAIEINHKKQMHLNEAMIHGLIKPFIFITNASNQIEENHSKKMKIQNLTNEILQVLSSNNGSVLIFSDTAGQIIEFLFILSNILRSNKYTCVDVILCSHVAHHVLKLVTANIEWLNDKLMKRMESGVFNFLGLLNLYTCQTLDEIDQLKSARIIITSNVNMEYNIGIDLFNRMASDNNNLIIYSMAPDNNSLAQKMMINSNSSNEISLTLTKRVFLVGRELELAYNEINECNTIDVNQSLSDSSPSTSDHEDTFTFGESFQVNVANNDDNLKNSNEIYQKNNIDYFNVKKRRYYGDDVDLYATKNIKIDPTLLQHMCDIFEKRLYDNNSIENHTPKPLKNISNTRFRKLFDVYGEIFKQDDFVKNVIQEKNIISFDNQVMKTAYNHAEINITNYPSKIETHHVTVKLNAKILFLNLNCAIDIISQTRMIESIQPKHLIVVSNNHEHIDILESKLEKALKNDNNHNSRKIIFHRVQFDKILDIYDEKQISFARIKDCDIENINFQMCSNVFVGWLDIIGKYHPINAFSYDYPILEICKNSNINSHCSIFINNIKINELKVKIENCGLSARIEDGMVFCADDRVKIFKTASNEINIEGLICQDYFKIKNLLYEQFCIL